jgi:hypothetical protein
VFIHPGADHTDGMPVLPWPSAAAVGLGLLDGLNWYDTVRTRLRSGETLHPTQDQRVTDALLAGRREPLWDGGRELKVQLFPDQFETWFGLRLATQGQAAALLFPQIDPEAAPTVNRLLNASARALSYESPLEPTEATAASCSRRSV